MLLLAAGVVEARAWLHELAVEAPDAVDFQGAVGMLATQLGEHAEAVRIAEWLAIQQDPYRHGRHPLWRGRILAHLDRKADAVAALRGALAHGLAGGITVLHEGPFVEPLNDYPPFQELGGRAAEAHHV